MRNSLQDEMARLDFDDKRLNQRCIRILEAFERCPEGSIPDACKIQSETKAAYRFFLNQKVSPEKILAPHIQATIQRCEEHPVILWIDDTSEEDFSENSVSQSKNLGRLDHADRKGFYHHTSIAVTPEGLSLGIVANRFFARPPESISNTRVYRHTALEEKESYRWVQGIKNASALAAKLTQTEVIYIADREGDTFHCLFEATKETTNCDIVIRGCKDRNTTCKIKGTKKKYKRMFQALQELEAQGAITFETQPGYGKKARRVTQVIRSGTLKIKPPHSEADTYHEIEINAVMLTEEDVPPGIKPINWVLLTTLPINTIEDVMYIIKVYAQRWKIEVFFKILKNCGIEDLKLIAPARLQACIASYMIIAWRLLHIQHIARAYPDKPCTVAFSELERRVVLQSLLNKRKQGPKELPRNPPSLREFIKALGTLGGFLGRKGDGEPGPKSICKGYIQMYALVEGWEMCQKFNSTCG